MIEIITKSAEETKKIAANLAQEIKKQKIKHAFVLALSGNLGSGKTTFIQGLAVGLGVKENVLSPTFLILKEFRIALKNYKNFYHVDAYRLKNPKELLELGFLDLLDNPENIIVVEWADKVRRLLPRAAMWLKFNNLGESRRKITSNAKFPMSNVKSMSKLK